MARRLRQWIFTLVLSHVIAYCRAFDPSESFDRNAFLDSKSNNGQYRLFWKIVGDEIVFEAHVATVGWIGLGFSPTGGMTGADIMVGGVKNGQPYIYVSSQNNVEVPNFAAPTSNIEIR